jgi:bifunctional DNA-binding transcriptional regulator/antitoxin component of YhaV-PrlF toxin-antitoxin module
VRREDVRNVRYEICCVLTVGDDGQVTVPAGALQMTGFRPGDRVALISSSAKNGMMVYKTNVLKEELTAALESPMSPVPGERRYRTALDRLFTIWKPASIVGLLRKIS